MKKIWSNIKYGMGLSFRYSKSFVISCVVTKIIDYFLWVFYTAYFVQFVLDTIENEKPIEEILLNIGIIGGGSLLLQAFQFFYITVIKPTQEVRVYHGLYKQIYQKAEKVELSCFEDPTFYNKISVALDNVGGKLSENLDSVGEMIGGILGGVLACFAMIKIDPWTIVFLVAPLLGNFLFAPKLNKVHYERYKEGVPYDRKISYVNRVMYLSKYAKEMRLFPIYRVIKKTFAEATESKSNLYKKFFTKAFWYGMLQYVFSYVIIFEGILLYGAYRAIVVGDISFSQMAVLTSVMVAASWIWVRVISAYNISTEVSLVLADVKEFFAYESKITENQDGIVPDKTVKSIEFRNVTFAYEGGEEILHGLSFRLEGTDKLALVGHNGAGKTTIIKLLLRLYDPTEGEILVNDVNIKEYKLEDYRNLFACAFQDYQIFASTIKENVLMGREGTDEQVIEALKVAGIYDKVQTLPKGIHTMLTKEFEEEGALLSGGEFQKIACARVFADQGKVSLFDEPSSALDPISENELFTGIMKSVEKHLGIFISHRLSTVKNANIVLMLENGRIIERGDHASLMAKKGAYYEMYRVQEKNYFTYNMEGEEVAR